MLQIGVSEVIENERLTFTLILRGMIDEMGTRELEQRWLDLRSRIGEGILVVDLSEAEVTCEQGRRLISRLTAEGARFRGAGPSANLIIDLVCREQKEATRLGRRFTSIVFLSATLTVGIICRWADVAFVFSRFSAVGKSVIGSRDSARLPESIRQ